MAEYFSVTPNGRGIYLVGDFATQPDAQAFADANGLGVSRNAVATLSITFLANPEQQSINLQNAKNIKLRELSKETLIRLKVIDPLITSVNGVYAAVIITQHLSATGVLFSAVLVAAQAAAVTINGFVDINDVNNYDVVTDPTWP